MGCPSEEQLAGFLLDSQAPDLANVREHITTCAQCQAWLAEVRAEDDDLQHVRRVLIQEQTASTRGGSSIAIGGPDLTTFSVGAMVSSTPELQEYEILQEIGRGGMGAVYLATQKSTKRKVALKVLLEGPFASAQAKRRFEREVELAAHLQHPHVVTILESGISSGRYYFAMQYVEGERLDVFLADRKKAIPAALRLFRQICEAVSYAHQRGVIHRDLKPSNILVDAAGEPHILDFGLAKVADSNAAPEAIELSVTGQLMGTLPYMSPEQAQGLHHDLDIRTDVYSLGVIMYETLTGKFPYPVTGKISEILTNITETAPRRPSQVDSRIDNEVETILLKALSKERERRYQSAGELARDLAHYLAGEPIEAKRDSTVYVLRKMLRRHRVPVAATLVFLLVLLGGALGLTAQQSRLRETRAVKEAANLLAASMYDPGRVVHAAATMDANVRRHCADLVNNYLASDAYPERVMGGRTGLLFQPAMFWWSVDSGPLWRHGEWLEVAHAAWPVAAGEGAAGVPRAALNSLIETARVGTERQKYAALCLLGHFNVSEAAELMAQAALKEPNPGVSAAGSWAAAQVGRQIQPRSGQFTLVDELTGLGFVRVPGTPDFRPGSAADDPDRYDNENRPAADVPIASFMMSSTEVTVAAFRPFFEEMKNADVFGAAALGRLGNEGNCLVQVMTTTREEHRAKTAVSWVSLNAAKAYCDWLSHQPVALAGKHHYRLPTETEWEWACRGGNLGRFCYGDDALYAGFFARCNGYRGLYRVAECMPSFYGLFDMHGGLWELCDSVYPGIVDTAGQPVMAVRGGAYYSPAVRCRSSQRNSAAPYAESEYTGFRLILEIQR